MATYRVYYIYHKVDQDLIEAESVDDAKAKWEAIGYDADLFIIEDEEGNQEVYD